MKVATYVSAVDHLLRNVLNILAILVTASVFTSGEDVPEIVLQEARIATVCQACVILLGYFLGHVKVRVAELVQQCPSEVRSVSYVCNFLKLFWQARDGDEVFETTEADMGTTALDSKGTKTFAIGPHVTVWDSEEICKCRE